MSNDRLKFRAWDIDHKLFIYFDLSDPFAADELIFGRHGVMENTVVEPWQQSTGLLDSEDRLIYESDIVEYKTKWKTIIDVVTWNDDFACFTLPKDGITDWQLYCCEYRILGNIYETPTLLNQPKGDE